jgi:hypothetical protein
MKNLLREPLVHFLLVGTVLFAADALLAKRDEPEPGKIVVTQGHSEHMAAVHERTWRRPPTQEDLKGLIDNYVREEVLYREGLALGLDRDDPVIRRRMRQKMELLAEDAHALVEPSDRNLQAYLDTHRARFAIEPKISFRQVYLDPGRDGRDLDREMARLLAELKRMGDSNAAERAGDATQLEHKIEAALATDIGGTFGQEFAAELATLPQGQWQGPVRSAYGLHFVLVNERTEPRAPALAEVREAVRREWTRDRLVAGSEGFYQRLLQRYTVTIEHPKVARAQ